MFEPMIDACPEELWERKAGGFVFWQQVLHALCGADFWTRLQPGPFSEPFAEREVYPELERDPVGSVTKEEMRAYASSVRAAIDRFLDHDDAWFLKPCALTARLSNLDVALGQLRHLQYHAGHCNSIFRERDIPAVAWSDG